MVKADGGPGCPPPPTTKVQFDIPPSPPPFLAAVGGDRGGGTGGGVNVVSSAVVVHGVACWQRLGNIMSAAWRLKLGGGRRVLGVRWLLGCHRRLFKRVSSVVLFFDGELPLEKAGLWFEGQLCPVEVYDFDRGRSPS